MVKSGCSDEELDDSRVYKSSRSSESHPSRQAKTKESILPEELHGAGCLRHKR